MPVIYIFVYVFTEDIEVINYWKYFYKIYHHLFIVIYTVCMFDFRAWITSQEYIHMLKKV